MRIGLGVLAAIMLSVPSAQAGKFDGWCLPDDGCMGHEVAIDNDAFGTCEGRCWLTEPTVVNEMDAMLYRLVCQQDGTIAGPFRVFVSEVGFLTKPGVVMVSEFGVVELTECTA